MFIVGKTYRILTYEELKTKGFTEYKYYNTISNNDGGYVYLKEMDSIENRIFKANDIKYYRGSKYYISPYMCEEVIINEG